MIDIAYIRKIKIVITFLIAITIFIGAQVCPATTSGETQSMPTALLMALLIYFLFYLVASDYMYEKLRGGGLDIKYSFFQFISLFIILFMFYIVMNAYFSCIKFSLL